MFFILTSLVVLGLTHITAIADGPGSRTKSLKFDDDLVEGLPRNLYDSLRTTKEGLPSMPNQIDNSQNSHQEICNQLLIMELRRAP